MVSPPLPAFASLLNTAGRAEAFFYVGQRGEVVSHSADHLSGEEILVLFCLEIFCCSSTPTKAFPITELLNIAKSGSNPTVPVGVVSVEGHANLSITAGVHFALIQDRLYMGVHHLRGYENP